MSAITKNKYFVSTSYFLPLPQQMSQQWLGRASFPISIPVAAAQTDSLLWLCCESSRQLSLFQPEYNAKVPFIWAF